MENEFLSGISNVIAFTLKIRNDKLVLTMFEQDLIFEKDVNIVNQQPNNKQRVDGSYLESSLEYSKKEIGVNNNNQDDIVGNYDIMNHDKFIIEVSIRNYSGNKYVGNSSKSEFYFVKNSSGEFIGEGFSFRFSGNNLILNENGQEFRLVNRRPYKLIPKEVLKIDDRLLGNWKGTSSSYYGGHSTVTKYQINFRNDGSYLEVTDFSTGGYSGSASLLDDAKKGNYHIIQQTNTGGKIKIYGKELEYVLLNDNKKLFLYGVTYYKQ